MNKTITPIKDSCWIRIFIGNGHAEDARNIHFEYTLGNPGYADVVVTSPIEEFAFIEEPTDLKFDILTGIGDHINKKINDISWT